MVWHLFSVQNVSAIDKCWWQSLEESIREEAAEEEKRIAIEKGSYHEGVPSITVTLDAGWSKHSHKHSYNAISVRSRNYCGNGIQK